MVIKTNVSSQLFFIFSNNHRFCYCLYSKLLMKKHLIISGRVQGVGFRYWLQKIAIEKNIFGWVKNKISGNVEALIIGEEKEVKNLIKLCEKGPLLSKVDHVKVKEYKKNYLKKNFNIIKSD